MRTLTSVEAQNRFGQLLDTVQREPITITRRGRPVAMIVAPRDYADLVRGQPLPLVDAARAIASFRSAGHGRATKRLLADRQAERRRGK